MAVHSFKVLFVMEMRTRSFIDFRILSSPDARGLINFMIGYKAIDPNVIYLVNQLWQKYLLLDNGVKRRAIPRA